MHPANILCGKTNIRNMMEYLETWKKFESRVAEAYEAHKDYSFNIVRIVRIVISCSEYFANGY